MGIKINLAIILFIALFPVSCTGEGVYWEDLNKAQRSDILNMVDSESVIKFYNGDFILSDDGPTDNLLEELTNPTDTVLPLYFFLFNKIVMESDGALATMVSGFCFDFLVDHTEFVFTYFHKQDDNKLLEVYSLFIGSELYFNEIGVSQLSNDYTQLKTHIDDSITNNQLQQTVKAFWKKVDETIEYMRD